MDGGNARVMVFNAALGYLARQGNGENASFVLGASSLTSGGNGLTQAGISTEYGDWGNNNNIRYDPGSSRLFVADMSYNRIMIFEGSFMPSWPADVP